MENFISFDEIWSRLEKVFSTSLLTDSGLSEIWLVRDLMGRVRLLLPEPLSESHFPFFQELAKILERELGAHAHRPEQAVLVVTEAELELFKNDTIRREILLDSGIFTIFMIDRLVTGSEWATVSTGPVLSKPLRFTLFSIKGGVGRSTTAAVLAVHLARQGQRVLIMDLDLESPGLSSLLPSDNLPDFGIVDWFVEDLVGQGNEVVQRMVGRPSWSQDYLGEIMIVPAYGHQPKEPLAKLGRVYLDLPQSEGPPEKWTKRLLRLLQSLEEHEKPDIVLLDSRNGLHDIAAATVTDIQAHVLLFARNSDTTWDGYRVLFQHWHDYGVVTDIREHFSLVAAMVPDIQPEAHLASFREQAWNLFLDMLYDEVPPGSSDEDFFSFDIKDEAAPHTPFPIYWNRGLAELQALRDLSSSVLEPAYGQFLERFDALLSMLQG